MIKTIAYNLFGNVICQLFEPVEQLQLLNIQNMQCNLFKINKNILSLCCFHFKLARLYRDNRTR